MTLKIHTNFPGGNAAGIQIRERDGLPEVRFASDPCGGIEALWFYFRIEETEPDPTRHTKIRLTWTMIDTIYGSGEAAVCVPASGTPGSTWSRLKQGEESRNEDGLRELSWQIPHPAPTTEVALCFPYGQTEMDNLLDRSRDFWKAAPIGISQGGRVMRRVYNNGSGAPTQPGIFLLARVNSGETPGSWVLDGFLRQWALAKKGGYCVWSIPFADIDGVEWGWYGRDNIPFDLDHAFGEMPMRHEAMVIEADLQRWKSKCKPLLVIDLHATGAFEKDGVYAYTSSSASPTAAEESKWCNVIKNELRVDYAAADFARQDQRPTRSANKNLVAWVREKLSVPAIYLQIPYGLIGGNPLSQKMYREIGQRIVQAILRRNG